MRKTCSWTRWLPLLLTCSFLLATAPRSFAYSVLTHEEIIDLLWDQQIVPLLKARFPNATPDELKSAHAYAYGGSVMSGHRLLSLRRPSLQRPNALCATR